MTGPIVFVSHFNLRPGKVHEYRRLQLRIAAEIEADKPGTLVFLAHLNDAGTKVTVTHVFRDAEAMDRHFEGSDDRSKSAAEVMTPAGWEIYGSPSETALENIQVGAAASGVSLTLAPEFVAGYVRS